MARVKVITGVERHRRWSDEQKRAIVAESFAPGAVVSEVARRADVGAKAVSKPAPSTSIPTAHSTPGAATEPTQPTTTPARGLRRMLTEIADEQVLHLTTTGRRTGLPREIEIWFVVYRDRFYLFAETGEAAAWVMNIRGDPAVVVRVGERQIGAAARVLDRETDRELWDQVAAIANRKYGWGDGLPVEITPATSRRP
jgi:deazaflavin-dependent oxidoreductase (nitroreductase family)